MQNDSGVNLQLIRKLCLHKKQYQMITTSYFLDYKEVPHTTFSSSISRKKQEILYNRVANIIKKANCDLPISLKLYAFEQLDFQDICSGSKKVVQYQFASSNDQNLSLEFDTFHRALNSLFQMNAHWVNKR